MSQPEVASDAAHRACPWWLGYLLVTPLRRIAQPPVAIVGSYVRPGMTVLEPGPGMGFFTLDLARMVGEQGKVIAVDLQTRMLEALRRRALRAGVGARIETRVAAADSLNLVGLDGRVDFTLAFAMVHELPSAEAFFRDVAAASKPGARLLLAEPAGHVSPSEFGAELEVARKAGFAVAGQPRIWRSHAALLERVPA
jgi:ubiquinone/menaquinone biosynthesis C-methylase UbiE